MVGVICSVLRLRCRECGWSGDQQSYRLHSSLNRHVLIAVERPICQADEAPCASCAADARVRAELHDLHVLDRAAAPDPEDVVATMRANGLHDPESSGRD